MAEIAIYEHFYLGQNYAGSDPALVRYSDTEEGANAIRGEVALALIDAIRDASRGRVAAIMRSAPGVRVECIDGRWMTQGTCRIAFKEGSEPAPFTDATAGFGIARG